MICSKGLEIGYKNNKENFCSLNSEINIVLGEGQLTCLLGPNGAGKSTLIKTFAGLLNPLKGEIKLQDRPLREYKLRELAKNISVVLTERSQFFNMTVDELVSAGRYPYTGFFGRLKPGDIETVIKAIDIVGLKSLRRRKLLELSDGERQKAMIAKALAQQTPIIILDEPTAFLDLPSKIEVMQLLHNLAAYTGKSILLSTHDMELALKFADKLWLIAKKTPIMEGTPEDLVINGQVEKFFGRKGIHFDKETGTFKLKNGNRKKIQVNGSGIEFIWLSNALARNGYAIVPKAGITIDIINHGSRQYIIKNANGDKKKVYSIGNIIDELKNS